MDHANLGVLHGWYYVICMWGGGGNLTPHLVFTYLLPIHYVTFSELS